MSAHLPRRAPQSACQRGQAMLLTVLLLGVGVSAVIYNFVTPAKQAVERDRITAAALAQAKAALIGYAAANASQPGVLPCPDTDNDGSADAPCGALGATAIGRLPWRTLGVAPLRDGMGECLWYAVSGNFKNSGVSGPAVLNSDSLGTLVVNDSTGTAVLSGSNAALAIVFAAGAQLPTQDRTPTGTSVCGGNTNAASYLDTRTIGATTFNNATGGGTSNFVMAATTPGPTELNDRLLPITRDVLLPVVEMRVAREVRQVLRSYYAVNHYYPPAAQFTGTAWVDGLYRGRVPTDSCSPVTGLALPAWFAPNNWHRVMIYAVAPRCTPALTPSGTTSCASSCTGATGGPGWTCPDYTIGVPAQNCNNVAAGPYLSIDGSPMYQAAIFAAGHGVSGQARPCGAIVDCLEAVGASNENIDAVDNYAYVKPVRSATNNDNLVIVAP